MRRKSIALEMIESYIAEELLVLLERDRFSGITVGEITDRSGVSRSVYYHHFKRKEDVVFNYFLLWFSRNMEDSPTLLAESAIATFPDGFTPYRRRKS